MSFSVQPDEIIGIADRVRLALDDALDQSNALSDAVDALTDALAGLPSVRAAFDEVARTRVQLARGIVSRGRSVLSVLRSVVLAFVEADDDMAASTTRAGADLALFDSARFGRVRR
ncbi:hypothetical protein [Microbacterium proteolyticum]|uniref:hypothetical protein n=1 Tax=Microbacterium proteolyticum TaxID=1572644 RepID=UPI001FABD20F|nr:hypothetical protein [Microbacterium proteolyticum]MCI9858166.1 hypothetical protein [Microbacterium proteolyticum]